MFPLRFVYFIPSRPRNHNQNQNRNHNHRNANANADVNHHEVEFLNIQLHLDTIRSYDNDSDTSTRNNDNDNTRRKRQRTATGLNLNLSLNNTSTAKDKNARKSDTNSDTINANTNISTMDMTISFSRVSDSYGLLEYILSYSPPQDLLCAAQVNRQWYHCARQDDLWRQACIYLWRDKVGMPLLRRGNSIALFWRSFWDVSAVLGSRSGSGTRSPSGSDPYLNLNSESRSRSGSGPGPGPGLDVNSNGDLGIGNTARMAMRVKDMRGLFTERPLGRRAVRDLFSACLEKSDMQRAILDLMPDELGLEVDHSKDGSNAAQHKYRNLQERMHGNRNGHEHGHGKVLRKGFDRLWFGSYASSIIDSRRTVMTLDELLSRRGFLMHFKVFHHSHDYNGEIRGTRTQGPEEISLHYHCVCYFDEATAAATMSQSDGSRDGSSEREGGQGGFRMDESRDNDMHHPQDLSWHWIHAGRTVQVGQYPPLVLHRRPNWGWKLENHHVVLYSQ